tara:strand:+ start:514 stop:1023 length:510 start_codon:yes stop_codon:yes gene_type:complete
MSDTKTKINWADIAVTQKTANQVVWNAGKEGLFSFLQSVPVPSGYYCNDENCSGHSLAGTELEPLTSSGKFSYYQNGNGFSLSSAASTAYTDPDGNEKRIDFCTTINAMAHVIPVCPSSPVPVINIYKDADGRPSKVTVNTRKNTGDEAVSETAEEKGKARKDRRRTRR